MISKTNDLLVLKQRKSIQILLHTSKDDSEELHVLH